LTPLEPLSVDPLPSDREAGLRQRVRTSALQTLARSLRTARSYALQRPLRQALEALRQENLDQALRAIDQAWRCHPDDASVLAPIYGRLLALESAHPDAALRLLQRALSSAPDAELAALKVHALLRLERAGEARTELEASLQRYCVVPDGILALVASRAVQHKELETVGWVGVGPGLDWVGELSADVSASSLEVHLDDGPAFTQPLRGAPREGRLSFLFALPGSLRSGTLRIESRGVPLLGSGRRLPLQFSLDGRAEHRRQAVSGWARMGWLPQQPLRLCFEDETGARHIAATERRPSAEWRWPFRIDLSRTGLRGERITISAYTPDGRWQRLPDAPLLLERAVRPFQAARAPSRRAGSTAATRAKVIDVVIHVGRGQPQALPCLESVLATAGPSRQVIVIDDATDDPLLSATLFELATAGRIELIRNGVSRGLTRSVNQALALHPTHDAVLLDARTLAFGDWLERLRAAAYASAATGVATPLSNTRSFSSLAPPEASALHTLASSVHPGVTPVVPVAASPCLYLRRDCLHDVGALDEKLFGDGPGGEIDLCLRAGARGWVHRLAADVFVSCAGDDGQRTEARSAPLERARRLLSLRHPRYDRLIADFQLQSPLPDLCRRLDEQRLRAVEGRFVLLVTLALAGGVDRVVAERCRRLRAQGSFPLVLRPAAAGDSGNCELWTDAVATSHLRYRIPENLAELTALLGGLRLDGIEIHHFLHLDPRVIDAVRGLGRPYEVFVHDYAWICPRITLIDGSGRYCGEPAVAVCKACVQRHGSHLGESIAVPALRQRSARWLRDARRVIAPSEDAAARLGRHFPGLAVEQQPHTEISRSPPLSPRVAQGRPLRVALIGGLGAHKGYRVLLACARDARARRLPLEFIVIGYTENNAQLEKTGKVFVTGHYSDGEVAHLLRREQPDLAFIPSVWPETWCFALDHALQARLPVVAFNLGAIAERLRAHEAGLLLPLSLTPRQINDCLGQLASAPDVAQLRIWQKIPPSSRARLSSRDDATLSDPGEKTMNKTSEAAATHEDGLSASVQILPLPGGLYLFSVKAAPPPSARPTSPLSLPAIHVGLGPGVRPEQVEFIAGPSTHGAWLFAAGDLLVTKVNGAGATLILTSVRAPGGEMLTIKVERLESRAEASAPAEARPPLAASKATNGSARANGARARAAADEAASSKAATTTPAADPDAIPLQIGAHIRSRGDMRFADAAWAGRVGPGLWIESFAVRPLQRFTVSEIEYKGLTGSGFETPWVTDEQMCGTKGMATPLIGFAVRLKPKGRPGEFDCEYSGYFKSGLTVGPMRNGAPCRSTVANDPLEGIQIRIAKRAAANQAATEAKPADGAHRRNGSASTAARRGNQHRATPGRVGQSSLRSPSRRR
jgi:GT2 family glycosyltransferase